MFFLQDESPDTELLIRNDLTENKQVIRFKDY